MSYTIKFEHVIKEYPLYHHISSGLKTLLLNPKGFIGFLKSKKYLALNDISFEVKAGDSVALIGRNGAGKSTTLSLIAGVLKPTKGKVYVNGRVGAMLELGGGFHPDLSGRDNIRLNAILLGMTRKEVDKKMEDIITFSELGDFIDEPIRIYSSGMLAKLGFSVITSINPDILVIDEVLAVGDAEFQQKCLTVINQFKQQGTTIFLVSHNMDDVRKFCDSVIWIENKKIKKIGKASIITHEYDHH